VPAPGSESSGQVGIVGGGTIGAGWAVVFARAGLHVAVFEPDTERRKSGHDDVATRLARLSRGGLLDEPPDAVVARVSWPDTLEATVAGSSHIQECAPEQLAVKRELFAALDSLAAPDTVLASSSSALTVGSFADTLTGRSRCLVAHPGNPPYLLPVVELVPASFTEADAVSRARRFFNAIGMSPVVLAHELEGFIFNRLQGALLREAYCLVRDGVAGVEDIDRVVRDGLGRRWAVLGPFETAALNAHGGIRAHADRMGAAYARMGAERGQDDPWTPDLVARVADELERRLPPEAWAERVAWRDDALIALEGARRASGLFATSAGEAA
jgi:3-hydroxyacyl-CoA dehydrogenase